jgi:hypothetical protein
MVVTEEQKKEAHAFYKEALNGLNESGAEYLLGGAFALFHHTGIYETLRIWIFFAARRITQESSSIFPTKATKQS